MDSLKDILQNFKNDTRKCKIHNHHNIMNNKNLSNFNHSKWLNLTILYQLPSLFINLSPFITNKRIIKTIIKS